MAPVGVLQEALELTDLDTNKVVFLAALGLRGARSAALQVAGYLTDDAQEVRMAALDALIRIYLPHRSAHPIFGAEVGELLLGHFDAADALERPVIVRALGALRYLPAQETLARTLKQTRADRDEELHRALIWSLAVLRHAEAPPHPGEDRVPVL